MEFLGFEFVKNTIYLLLYRFLPNPLIHKYNVLDWDTSEQLYYSSTFQPDFIVKYKNGKVGIFDTKAVGDREAENKLKAEALQKYIEEENNKGANLFGSLVIKPGEHFRVNYSSTYQSFKVKEKDWKYLSF